MDDVQYVLSRWLVVYPDGHWFVVQNVKSGRTAHLDYRAFAATIRAFDGANATDLLKAGLPAEELDLLVARRILVGNESREAESPRYWHVLQLAFQRLVGKRGRGAGGTGLSGVEQDRSEKSGRFGNSSGEDRLRRVLHARVTERMHGQSYICVHDIQRALQLATEVRWSKGEGAQSRPYPSAGGIHPLGIYVVLAPDHAQQQDCFAYCASRGALEPHRIDVSFPRRLFRDAWESVGWLRGWNPTAVVIVTASVQTMLEKYPDAGMYYVYLETGAFLQTLQLVVGNLSMAACILGGERERHNVCALGLDPTKQVEVGAMAIGSRVE